MIITFDDDCAEKERYDIVEIYNPLTCQHLDTREIDEMEVIYKRKSEIKINRLETCKMIESFFGGYEIKITD